MSRPATARELQKVLEETKLYPWHAAANGREIYEGLVLRKDDGLWQLFHTGPGMAPNWEEFSTEAEAVHRFIERLTESLPMDGCVIEQLRRYGAE
ncbi:MAG: hypothetical protein QM770_05265 [Tepidisphaeraceae bacterium]